MRRTAALAFGASLLLAVYAHAQAPLAAPTFDVASIKPSAPLDMGKLQAQVQAGKMPNFGPHIGPSQAEYIYMTLKDLVGMAWSVKTYQIAGPAWLGDQHFDIVARIPEGAKKDDVPLMLQALLAERFKLAAHRETVEKPSLALIVGKNGPKLKESPPPATPVDEAAPLKDNEMKIDTPDGPARMTRSADGRGATIDMGAKGTFTQSFDMQAQAIRMSGTNVTMPAFAAMLNNFMTMGLGNRPIVDMTGLTGHYDVALEISLGDLRGMGGGGPPGGGPGGGGPGAPSGEASDPGGAGSAIFSSVEKLGLKLDPRKEKVEQIVVDHAEKTPTEN